jgi:hypothetical protein
MAEMTISRSYAVAHVSKIERSEDGTAVRTVLAAPRKKKVSKRYKKVDKLLRRLAKAQQVSSSDFLRRHELSNSKKKNGGVRKFAKNAIKSGRKGGKKLRVF